MVVATYHKLVIYIHRVTQGVMPECKSSASLLYYAFVMMSTSTDR
jgi:hypothetical protein